MGRKVRDVAIFRAAANFNTGDYGGSEF